MGLPWPGVTLQAGIEKSGNIGYRAAPKRLSIDGKIGKKSAKSPIYRRNIGEAPIYRRKIAENIADISVFHRFFGKFPDISYQSSPRTGYKIWLKIRGFRVREI